MTPGDGPLRERSSFVVLSGGESRRMGRDKAFVRVGGREMLDRLLEVGRAACGECVVVVNEPGPYGEALRRYGWRAASRGSAPSGPGSPPGRFRRGRAELRLVTDRHPGLGPVAGLEAGLDAARGELCFAAACDLPFLAPRPVNALLRELEALRAGSDDPGACAVVPVAEGRLQPLAAAYSAGAARGAARCVAGRELRMDDLLGRLTVRRVDAEALPEDGAAGARRWFVNVNRPEELRAARRRARRRDGSP